MNLTLDGCPVTEQQLREARANPSIKIIETAPGVYKTLSRLQG